MDGSIHKYRAFVKAVETGSFTRAAEILHYTQSGVSRMISDLEKEWKVVLLERGKSGVTLTSDGTKLLPFAKNIVHEYDKLQMEIDELGGLQSGLIRIGTFSSVAIHWLPNIIKEFQKVYPNIDYELLLGDYTEIEDWILEGRVDCGFLRLPTHPDFETVFLEEDKLMAVLPESHPLASLDKVPITALTKEPFMLLEKGAKSLIFDVRNNPGGTLDSIVPILDYILPEGPIIRTISKYGTSEEKSDAAELSLPMVVLANASSASAAELFTSALMDYNKATFIGEKTFGKGTMQTNIPLTDGSVLHLTTHYYLPPKSDSFDEKGIVPDIEVKLSEESEKNFFMLSETEDEQLAAALDYLKR